MTLTITFYRQTTTSQSYHWTIWRCLRTELKNPELLAVLSCAKTQAEGSEEEIQERNSQNCEYGRGWIVKRDCQRTTPVKQELGKKTGRWGWGINSTIFLHKIRNGKNFESQRTLYFFLTKDISIIQEYNESLHIKSTESNIHRHYL